jgi:hypothetical protein
MTLYYNVALLIDSYQQITVYANNGTSQYNCSFRNNPQPTPDLAEDIDTDKK